MRRRINVLGRQVLVPSILLAMSMASCAPAAADTAPTLSVDAIFTAAAETLRAQEATQLAMTPPTDTSSPSPFPTLPPASPLPTLAFASATPFGGGPSSCDNSTYVADTTIPDGTVVKAGEKFTKTWKLYNSGTCNWTTAYKMVFVGGEGMAGATTVLPAQVNSGSQADVSVGLTAPAFNGSFVGSWRLQNAGGVFFGNTVTVEIKVTDGTGASPTAGPSPTGGATSTNTFAISGNAGVGSGVVVSCVGKNANKPTVQATVDNLGNYVCNVPLHWAGSIEPSKQGWNFTPLFTNNIDDVTGDLPNQDFTASQ